MNTDSARALHELVARMQIRDVYLRYCRACDRVDGDLMRSVFHQDARIDYGVYAGKAPEFCAWIIDNIRENYTYGFHSIANDILRLDGDVAHAELYAVIHNGVREAGRVVEQMLGGRYLDRYECRRGEWRIAERRFVLDWCDALPHKQQVDLAVNDGLGTGKGSREDASYGVLPPEPRRTLDW